MLALKDEAFDSSVLYFFISRLVSHPCCIQFSHFSWKGETWAGAEKCILYNPIDFKLCHLIGGKNALTALLCRSLICFSQLHAASNLSPEILIELSYIEMRDGSRLVDHHGYGRTGF